MHFYSTDRGAYSDQETKSWDFTKAELSKDVLRERTDPAKLAIEADAHELTKETEKPTKTPAFVCSWDGLAPYVTTLRGTFPLEGIPVMGWPQTDQPPEPGKPGVDEIAFDVEADAKREAETAAAYAAALREAPALSVEPVAIVGK